MTLDQLQSDFLTAPPLNVQYQNEKGLTSQQEALLDVGFPGTNDQLRLIKINFDQLWSPIIKFDQL